MAILEPTTTNPGLQDVLNRPEPHDLGRNSKHCVSKLFSPPFHDFCSTTFFSVSPEIPRTMPINSSGNVQTLSKPDSGDDNGQPERNDMQIGGSGGGGKPKPKPKPEVEE